jgi:predicted Holliday junction resolvase-like endonuclease
MSRWDVGVAALLISVLGVAVMYLAGLVRNQARKLREAYDRIEMISHLAEQRAATQSGIQRSVHIGHTAELIATLLPGFPALPVECRFLGSPIDYIAFEGLEGPGLVTVVFIEVKSGRHQKLSDRQIRIRGAIDARRVKWVTYSVPADTEPGSAEERETVDPRRELLKKLREKSQHGKPDQS